MHKRIPPKLKKLASKKQDRLDELLNKNSEGTVTSMEKAELKRLVAEAERIMVANAKVLATFAKQDNSHPPNHSVPVTVWIHSEPAGQ